MMGLRTQDTKMPATLAVNSQELCRIYRDTRIKVGYWVCMQSDFGGARIQSNFKAGYRLLKGLILRKQKLDYKPQTGDAFLTR